MTIIGNQSTLHTIEHNFNRMEIWKFMKSRRGKKAMKSHQIHIGHTLLDTLTEQQPATHPSFLTRSSSASYHVQILIFILHVCEYSSHPPPISTSPVFADLLQIYTIATHDTFTRDAPPHSLPSLFALSRHSSLILLLMYSQIRSNGDLPFSTHYKILCANHTHTRPKNEQVHWWMKLTCWLILQKYNDV